MKKKSDIRYNPKNNYNIGIQEGVSYEEKLKFVSKIATPLATRNVTNVK